MILKHYDLSENNVEEINKYIEDGKHVFILVYMEGCGPCNVTRPEWAKIKEQLKKYSNNDDIVVVDVDSRLSSALKHIGNIDGYPTMKYISNQGKMIEPYENSSVGTKDRSAQSFVEWIDSKMHKTSSKPNHDSVKLIKMSSPYDVIKRLETLSHTKKNHKKYHKKSNKYNKQKGGSWSIKYKRSINCKKPKGFSQKQYCRRQKRHGKYMTRRIRR